MSTFEAGGHLLGAQDTGVVIIHSKDLWLQDGTIIVRTTSTETPATITLYKIHKFILALHCSTFASLFEGTHALFDAGSESYDGLPIMDMPDAADDVRDFLKALYFPIETQRHRHISSPLFGGNWAAFPATYPGILRLAIKYDAPTIQNLIVKVLRMEWTRDVHEWDSLQEKLMAGASMLCEEEDLSNLFPDPVRAIRLGTELGIFEILPTAYYDLMRVLYDLALEPLYLAEPRSVDTSQLTADQLRRVIIGRKEMCRWLFQAMSEMQPPEAGCLHKASEPCRLSAQRWINSQLTQRTADYDPVAWLNSAENECSESDACEICVAWMQAKLLRAKWGIWEKLSEFFGLEDNAA
ncbi:hypothetical protein BV25DRAFT_1832812 [Artomyces pyxidatus]|uniref:Uncharacterized protein n=1 Tax=Artomyces pyxidatus TaxID=48021 RepID=A0ACB8SJC4_9AGAM|nr:hypothetical protein BV25DRAFT_1832812 [Artomyces pyxidatus]